LAERLPPHTLPKCGFSGTNHVCGAALARGDAPKKQGAVQGCWGAPQPCHLCTNTALACRGLGRPNLRVGSVRSSRSCPACWGLQAANASSSGASKNVSSHIIRNSSLSSWRENTSLASSPTYESSSVNCLRNGMFLLSHLGLFGMGKWKHLHGVFFGGKWVLMGMKSERLCPCDLPKHFSARMQDSLCQ